MNILTSEQQIQLLTELTPDWVGEEPDVNFPPSTPRSHRPLKSLRNLMAATLMLDCGLRVGELVQLTYSDCYFNHNAVNSLIIRIAISKSHKQRTIPLTARTKQVLNLSRSYFMPSIADPPRQYMFFARNWDTHITTRQIERIITTASMKAFGYPITPHMLRHTYATKLMRITDIRTVQELLGHKNVSSTQIYTHVNSDDLKEAVKRIDEADLEFSRPFPLAKL